MGGLTPIGASGSGVIGYSRSLKFIDYIYYTSSVAISKSGYFNTRHERLAGKSDQRTKNHE